MARLLPIALVTLVPLIFLGGLRLARLAVGNDVDDRRLAALLAPGCALALWLLPIHLVGLLTHSFWVGLVVGTLVAASFGAVALRLPGPKLPASLALGVAPWIVAGLAVALLFGAEARFLMWDELIVTGHLSIPLQMLNGIYPPRNLSFAQFELRYHYGFDLLCAVVAALLGQPELWKVVHCVTLGLFGLTAALLWLLGERWIGRRAGPVAASVVLLAGGLPLHCKPEGGRPLFLNRCMLPELPSNFLQHPWSLGIPVALTAALLFSARRTRSWAWWLALSLLMTLLSLSQVVLFGCLLFGVACAGALTTGPRRGRNAAIFGGWALGSLGCAWLCHGFFARALEPSAFHLTFQPFWHRHQVESYIAKSLGVSLLLGPVGFFYLRGERVLLAATALSSLTIFELFSYPTPWDMAKFLMVSQLVLALAASAALASWTRRSLALLGLAGAAFAGSAAMAATFYAVATFGDGKGFFPSELASFAQPADQEIAEYLRHQVGAGEMVLRSQSPLAYSVRAGIPTPELDDASVAFGFSRKLTTERSALLRRPSDEVSRYLDQSIDWIVLGPEDEGLAQEAAGWLATGRATEELSVPPLRLLHLR